jgi:alpha-tubulin suppressor-like RCC1 family protein
VHNARIDKDGHLFSCGLPCDAETAGDFAKRVGRAAGELGDDFDPDEETSDDEQDADDMEDNSEELAHVKAGGETKIIVNPEQNELDRDKMAGIAQQGPTTVKPR